MGRSNDERPSSKVRPARAPEPPPKGLVRHTTPTLYTQRTQHSPPQPSRRGPPAGTCDMYDAHPPNNRACGAHAGVAPRRAPSLRPRQVDRRPAILREEAGLDEGVLSLCLTILFRI